VIAEKINLNQQSIKLSLVSSRFAFKRPARCPHPAQVLQLPCCAQLGQVCRRPYGAAELAHQVRCAVDEALGVDTKPVEQFWGALGDCAAFVLSDAAAGGFDQFQVVVKDERDGGLESNGMSGCRGS
jgi:hypothetical protein